MAGMNPCPSAWLSGHMRRGECAAEGRYTNGAYARCGLDEACVAPPALGVLRGLRTQRFRVGLTCVAPTALGVLHIDRTTPSRTGLTSGAPTVLGMMQRKARQNICVAATALQCLLGSGRSSK
jgi:hypothetical protein